MDSKNDFTLFLVLVYLGKRKLNSHLIPKAKDGIENITQIERHERPVLVFCRSYLWVFHHQFGGSCLVVNIHQGTQRGKIIAKTNGGKNCHKLNNITRPLKSQGDIFYIISYYVI